MTLDDVKQAHNLMVYEINNGLNVHDELKSKSVPELREICDKDRYPFDVFCLNLTGDLNIGNIIRTSVLLGAHTVWVYGKRRFDARGTVGAQNYLNVVRQEGLTDEYEFKLDQFQQLVNEHDYYPIAVEQGGVELQDYDWETPFDKRILLVMGNENAGIPDDFLEYIREVGALVSIPQRGVLRSFNVSNAFSIVGWELIKNRFL